MKTHVVNEQENTRIPFLRGILTRSLLDSGLPFEDAFQLATEIRDELSDTPEVSSFELRRKVMLLLEGRGHEEVLEPYRLPVVAAPAPIRVIGPDGAVTAFSRGRHERYLQASGMKADRAEQITAAIYDQLLTAGVTRIETGALGYITYLCLAQEVSKKAAARYLVWSEFQHSNRPLMLMVCGTVGTGKSTLATEVAHLLDIVRIQSTDMLREVMRKMIPRRLLPVLHSSSFEAWKALPLPERDASNREQLLAEGYRIQAELLSVPCEAVMARAVAEGVPLILEGVHAHPDLMQRLPKKSDAIAVHVMLAVLKSKELKSRLRGRGVEAPQRRAKRYLNRFEAIWGLQTFLLSEADRCDVPIITNIEKDKAVLQIIQYINYELSHHFVGTPDTVFGEVVGSFRDMPADASWRKRVPLLKR